MARHLPRLVLTLVLGRLVAGKRLSHGAIQQVARLVAWFRGEALRLLLLRVLDDRAAEQLGIVMVLRVGRLFVQERAIALIRILAGCWVAAWVRITARVGRWVAAGRFVRDEAGAERGMVHLLTLVNLPVPNQLGLLLLELEVGDGL